MRLIFVNTDCTFARKGACCVIAVLALFAIGCNRFTDSKSDVKVKFAKQLCVGLKGRRLDIPEPKPIPTLTDVAVGTAVVSLPSFGDRPVEITSMGTVLDYDRYKVVIELPLVPGEGLSGLPVEWGRSDLEKLRRIYSISERDVDLAHSMKQLGFVVNGIVLKSMLLTDGAITRCVEFRTRSCEGFVLGSIDGGSRSVRFECFSIGDSDAPMVALGFLPADNQQTSDHEFEQFMSAVRVKPKK